MIKLDSRLARVLDKAEDLKQFEASYQNCVDVRNILANLCEQEIEKSRQESDKPGLLDSPNALAVLSDKAGYRRGIAFVLAQLTMAIDKDPTPAV